MSVQLISIMKMNPHEYCNRMFHYSGLCYDACTSLTKDIIMDSMAIDITYYCTNIRVLVDVLLVSQDLCVLLICARVKLCGFISDQLSTEVQAIRRQKLL